MDIVVTEAGDAKLDVGAERLTDPGLEVREALRGGVDFRGVGDLGNSAARRDRGVSGVNG